MSDEKFSNASTLRPTSEHTNWGVPRVWSIEKGQIYWSPDFYLQSYLDDVDRATILGWKCTHIRVMLPDC